MKLFKKIFIISGLSLLFISPMSTSYAASNEEKLITKNEAVLLNQYVTDKMTNEDNINDNKQNLLNKVKIDAPLLPNQKTVKTVETAKAPVVKKQEVKETTKKVQEKNYYELTVEATAYTAYCKGCSGITATGINLRANPNQKVIAVDPKVIPLGSKVEVEGYGTAIAGDTGGAIKGNKIDIFVKSKDTAYKWGRKKVKIKVYKK